MKIKPAFSRFVLPKECWTIQGPDRGGRHSFPIEMMYAFQNFRVLDFRKDPLPPITRKITLQKLRLSEIKGAEFV